MHTWNTRCFKYLQVLNHLPSVTKLPTVWWHMPNLIASEAMNIAFRSYVQYFISLISLDSKVGQHLALHVQTAIKASLLPFGQPNEVLTWPSLRTWGCSVGWQPRFSPGCLGFEPWACCPLSTYAGSLPTCMGYLPACVGSLMGPSPLGWKVPKIEKEKEKNWIHQSSGDN